MEVSLDGDGESASSEVDGACMEVGGSRRKQMEASMDVDKRFHGSRC